MNINYFLVVPLLLLLLACNHNKTDKFYYDSGELWYETYLIDKQKQIYHCTVYYKNGVIESEGTVLEDGTRDGKWKEYFSDGTLKWNGFMNKGNIVISKTEKMPNFIQLPLRLEIEGNPEVLKVGEAYKIRTIVEGIHPSIYDVLVSYPDSRKVENNKDRKFFTHISKNEEDSDRFPFVVTPKAAGKMYIMLVFPNEDGVLTFGIDELEASFVYNVVE